MSLISFAASASGVAFTTRALANTAQHAGQALGEFDVARALQRIDNRGELARREDEVRADLIDIQRLVISRIGRLLAWHYGRNHGAGLYPRG